MGNGRPLPFSAPPLGDGWFVAVVMSKEKKVERRAEENFEA